MSSTIHADSRSQGCDLLQRAIASWRKAQVLYQGHSWQGQPEALAIAEQIAACHPECEPMLADLLLDGSQLVVAYALLTLEFMRSPVLLNRPAELLQRRSQVTMAFSGVMTSTDLGALTRQVQKRAGKRSSDQPTPAAP
jgi:hypothetical protein